MLKRYKKKKNNANKWIKFLNNSSKIKETYFFKIEFNMGLGFWNERGKKFNLSFKDYEKNIRSKKILNYYNDKKFNWIKNILMLR